MTIYNKYKEVVYMPAANNQVTKNVKGFGTKTLSELYKLNIYDAFLSEFLALCEKIEKKFR